MQYTPPEVDMVVIPGVLGFVVTIYDEDNNNYSTHLISSGARSYTFNSTSEEFQAAGLVGYVRSVNVTVETEVGPFSNALSLFSGIKLCNCAI